MTLELFLKGLLIGFSIAMPVGPIGLLCIRNSLTYGMKCGLLTGLGAAVADAIYGALAGFGVSAISLFLESNRFYLQICGALFLCYLGLITFLNKSKPVSAAGSNSKVFFTTLFLTLTNPMTILSFAAVYAGLGIGSSSANMLYPLITTMGVFVGSAIWWLLLSCAASFLKAKMNDASYRWLNKLSGSIIFSFGLAAIFA